MNFMAYFYFFFSSDFLWLALLVMFHLKKSSFFLELDQSRAVSVATALKGDN